MKVVIDVTKFYDWEAGHDEEHQSLFVWEPIDSDQVPEDVLEDVDSHPSYRKAGKGFERLRFEGTEDDWRPAFNADGGILKRVLFDAPGGMTYTEIVIPQQQIDVVVDSPSLDHITEPYHAVAFHVARNMRLHAPRDAWLDVHVDEDPELASFLKSYFQMDRPTAPAAEQPQDQPQEDAQ